MPTCRAGCSKQKNALIPARKALRGGSGQKKASFPARNGIPTASEQKNAPNPARKVLRGGSGQKKVSFPARNGMPTACRAGKHLNSCAEGAPETSGAYVHIEVRFVDARMQSV